jgi:hypothetical protein
MTRFRSRVGRLETHRSGGGVVVTTWYDSRDDQKVAKAQQQADAQGATLIVIRKFSEPDYDTMTGAIDAP